MRLVTQHSNPTLRHSVVAQNPDLRRAEALFSPPAQLPAAAPCETSNHSDARLDAIDAFNPTDTQILISIRASASARGKLATLHSGLQQRACLFTDFNHFSRLCLKDLRQAFADDRKSKTRLTKNRRRTWFTMFRYFAAHADIRRTLEIRALDRQGNYTCQLIDRVSPDEWDKLLRQAQIFGITEAELSALLKSKQARRA